jgi:hypothetical protein
MSKRKRAFRNELLLGVLAVVTILVAWVIGARLVDADLDTYLKLACPEAVRFESVNGNTFTALSALDETIGYISISSANGYGGPMTLAVAIDLEGQVTGISIVDHKETPSYLNRVLNAGAPDALLGKTYQENFILGEDIDAVSGATYTTLALAEAVRDGVRSVAQKQLGLEAPSLERPEIAFGIPEITLIALYAVGLIGHQKKFKYKKIARWAAMLTGLLVLGFVYNRPLTLSHINQLLLGYFPQWQTNLYWYLLIGGILFVFTVDNKNPYCEWFCPFGAAQECMGAIGGAKARSVGRYREVLKWLTRIVVWVAIIIAMLFRNPGLTSYEVFGNLFSLTGSLLQFVVLGIVLVASLFIRRPWCTYLCPLRPVTDLYRTFRKWGIQQWQNQRPKRVA